MKMRGIYFEIHEKSIWIQDGAKNTGVGGNYIIKSFLILLLFIFAKSNEGG
jgi:hypothetical protein